MDFSQTLAHDRPAPGAAAAVTTDPVMPEVEVLLGREARRALAPALAADGHELQRLEPQQVLYRPGRSATVRYRAVVADPQGRRTSTALVAACGRDDPGGTAAIESDGARIAVWSPATDPRLPGLGRALDPKVVADLLRGLGVRPGQVRLRLRSYRPARRAVVEVTSAAARIYLKVVPPDAVEQLHNHHLTLAAHLPVPHSHGWSPELGIVVLQALQGRTLRAALDAGVGPLPGAEAVEDLLDRLPPVGGEVAVRRSSSHRRHCELLGHLVPDLTGRLDRLAARLDELVAADDGAAVPVHGDLHDAQLLVGDGRITGLLDVDGHGLGRRTDDLGTFLAHLAVRGEQSTAHGQRLADGFEARHAARAIRTAAAVRTVGLATGPFRVLQDDWGHATRQRVELAERWVAAAEDEDLLTPITPAPQDHAPPSWVSAQ